MDEELARRLSLGIDGQTAAGSAVPLGTIPGQMQNPFQGGLWRFGTSPCNSFYCDPFGILLSSPITVNFLLLAWRFLV